MRVIKRSITMTRGVLFIFVPFKIFRKYFLDKYENLNLNCKKAANKSMIKLVTHPLFPNFEKGKITKFVVLQSVLF